MFETDKEVLEWYERQPRALSKEYVNQIRWKDVSNYPLNEAFVPVLFYMRDIEYFTDMETIQPFPALITRASTRRCLFMERKQSQ